MSEDFQVIDAPDSPHSAPGEGFDQPAAGDFILPPDPACGDPGEGSGAGVRTEWPEGPPTSSPPVETSPWVASDGGEACTPQPASKLSDDTDPFRLRDPRHRGTVFPERPQAGAIRWDETL